MCEGGGCERERKKKKIKSEKYVMRKVFVIVLRELYINIMSFLGNFIY